MSRTYNVVDADGHVLEPLDLWENYLDPAYRDQAPQLIVDTHGKGKNSTVKPFWEMSGSALGKTLPYQ